MNKQRMELLAKRITKSPTQFFMIGFFSNDFDKSEEDLPNRIANCGTAACLAGHAVAMKCASRSLKKLGSTERACSIWLLAKKYLELDVPQDSLLFSLRNWPDEYRLAYNEATLAHRWKRRSEIAAARVRHMIATGE